MPNTQILPGEQGVRGSSRPNASEFPRFSDPISFYSFPLLYRRSLWSSLDSWWQKCVLKREQEIATTTVKLAMRWKYFSPSCKRKYRLFWSRDYASGMQRLNFSAQSPKKRLASDILSRTWKIFLTILSRRANKLQYYYFFKNLSHVDGSDCWSQKKLQCPLQKKPSRTV